MALYHAVQGSVGYTIVGTPTIVDGVASGFSLTDYCFVNSPFAPGASSWEEEICFKLDYPGSSINMALCNSTLKDFVFPKIAIITASSSTINIQPCLSANGTGWSIHQAVLTGVQFDYSKKGYVKIVYSPVTESSGTYTYLFKQEGDESYRVLSTDTNKPVIYQTANDPGFTIGADIGAGPQWNSYFRGKIYLEETCFKINGVPWFGICHIEVKSHQIKGQVGYTVVGSPTITDGMASNFSNSNYATTTSAFEVANYENVEIYVRAKTPATISSGWTDIIENGGVGGYRNLGAYANSDLTAYYFNFFGHDFWRYNISADTWYRLKLTTTADTQSGYIYDDNGNLLYQSNDARRIAGTSVLSFGGRYSPNKIGAIDFNNTYIKVNGQLWFWQPRPTQYIVKDGSLVWADQKLYLSGPVNYEVLGTPTITDGVVSNFSNTNYIQTSENFSFENPLEIYFTATTSSDVNTSQLFCSVGNGNANRSFGVTIEAGGKMGVAYTFNGYSWVGWLPSSYVFEGNTRYNFLIQYIPSQVFTINVKKATETSWTTFTNSISAPIYTSTDCPFIFGQNYQNKPFLGSIDLNETYIKANNQLWFYGKNYASKNIAPVPANYTYGNTTTSAIGWVDMRTQSFHEAPTGTIIEKDS